jgi:7-carboxy-7-deazaguanine synthase
MPEGFTVTEIYASIQGESSYAGYPCTFIRLTGCPLRCRWCDTVYGFKGGVSMTQDSILAEVRRLGTPLVELTGGEPLAQAGTPALMSALGDLGYKVLVETSGSEDLSQVPDHVHIIMDIKCPGSGMTDRNKLENLKHLKPTDEIKFVVAHREDFLWAKELIVQERLIDRFKVLLSCAWGLLQPKDLAAWMMDEPKLNSCRMQLQQHKYIWGPRAKGV